MKDLAILTEAKSEAKYKYKYSGASAFNSKRYKA